MHIYACFYLDKIIKSLHINAYIYTYICIYIYVDILKDLFSYIK